MRPGPNRPGGILSGLALAFAVLLQAGLVLGALGFAMNAAYGQQTYRIAGPVPYCGATLMEGPNPKGVSSAAPRGEGVILFDPVQMQDHPILKPFALAHECAHIVLGHITPQGQMRADQLFAAAELAADCWAAKALVKATETKVVTAQIARFEAELRPLANPRAPTWKVRARKIRDCLAIDETSDDQRD